MSNTIPTTTRRNERGPVVAIAGATGRLGQNATEVFLSEEFKAKYSNVIVLTREPSSENAKRLEALGAELRQFKGDGTELERHVLQGVDVVVNFLGSNATAAKEALVDAIAKSDVKTYFPSEYGIDQRLNDFGEWDSPDWIEKRNHVKRARELFKNKTRIISVYVGLFLDGTIFNSFLGPLLGFDLQNGVIEAIGSARSTIAFTTKGDIGRALAQLAWLSTASPGTPAIPDYVRICGSAASLEDIQHLIKATSGKIVEVRTLDGAAYGETVKEERLSGKLKHIAKHIRILMGEGKFDFSTQNDNELVNPQQSLWKWKTVEEQVQEVYQNA